MKESGQELEREWRSSIWEYLEEKKGRVECCNYIIISNIKRMCRSNFLKLSKKLDGFLGPAFAYFDHFSYSY